MVREHTTEMEVVQGRLKVSKLLIRFTQAQNRHAEARRNRRLIFRKISSTKLALEHCSNESSAEAIKQELKDLQSKYDMRDKEDDDSRASVKRLKAQVKIAVKKYTKLSCRALCDKVQDKLPAEIRSRIYEEVLGSQPYLCVSYCPQKYCNACGAPDFANLEWGWYELRDQLGHICDVEYVGASALQELAETWYRITSVLFACHANENDLCYTKSLEDTQDIWDTSELMKNRIKNVIVDIGPSFLRKLVSLKSDGLDFPEETMAEFGYPGVLERESYVFTHMFFIKGMNSLSCFRPGTKITIRIRNVHQNNPGKQDSEKEQLLAMLKVFFPAVSGLRDCGLRVEGLIGETRINEHFEFSAESWANKVMASG